MNVHTVKLGDCFCVCGDHAIFHVSAANFVEGSQKTPCQECDCKKLVLREGSDGRLLEGYDKEGRRVR